MLGLVIEDRGEGVCVEPWWGKDVGTALALQKEGKPEGNVVSVGRIEGS